MVGYSAPELLSRGWHDLTHPDDLSANLKAVEQVRQSAVSLEIEKRYIHKQGHSVWVCIRISRLLAAEAGPADVIIHVEDVTERKRIEEAVRRSEEKYRRLVDNLPDVTWTATATGRPIHISANVETVIGYTAKEVCESSDSLWFRVVHPDDIGRVRRALEGLFAANCPFDVEYRVRRRDGEWIWVRDRSSRIFVQEGVAYADGVFSDVTARRTAAELFESNLAGVFRALPNGRLIECNESLARIAGYDSAAAILEPARQTSSWTAVRRARWIGFSASGVW
jgi:PAS domain S-box-containing protein